MVVVNQQNNETSTYLKQFNVVFIISVYTFILIVYQFLVLSSKIIIKNCFPSLIIRKSQSLSVVIHRFDNAVSFAKLMNSIFTFINLSKHRSPSFRMRKCGSQKTSEKCNFEHSYEECFRALRSFQSFSRRAIPQVSFEISPPKRVKVHARSKRLPNKSEPVRTTR